jgi:hypothetical protein
VEDERDHESSELENGERYEVEVILDHKKVGNTTKYLIKWKGWANQYNEWKSEFQLRHSRDLINEYWIRKGGRPTTTAAGAAASKKPQGSSAIANTGSAIINAADLGAAGAATNDRSDRTDGLRRSTRTRTRTSAHQ